MNKPIVYISISHHDENLLIDGDLALFERFARLLQGDGSNRFEPLEGNREQPVVAGQGGDDADRN